MHFQITTTTTKRPKVAETKKETAEYISCSSYNESNTVIQKRFQDRLNRIEKRCEVFDPEFRENWQKVRNNGEFYQQ